MSFTTIDPSPMNNHKQCNKLKQKIKNCKKNQIEKNWKNVHVGIQENE
jgi:hypothetical protein